MTEDIILRAEGLGMSFPGVRALDDFSFDLRRGEVHCLLGENGAGKSTLINILSGTLPNYTGDLNVRGEPVRIVTPADARILGIGTIHQEFNLVPAMSVQENILLGSEPTQGHIFVDRALATERARKVLADLQVDITLDVLVRQLSTAQQQMIEIAKALSLSPDILILDEPTASISERDVDELFRIIRLLKAKGTSFVYVSHRLQELRQIGDRVTVMRDGRYVATLPIAQADSPETIKMMVGRTVSEGKRRRVHAVADAPVALSVAGMHWRKKVRNVSFELHQGEILGFAGLVGAGRTELMKLIFGALHPDRGEIRLHGRPVSIRSPQDAVRAGIGYLSEDRKTEGLVLSLSVASNIVLPSLHSVSTGVFVDRGREKAVAERFVGLLKIATPDIDRTVRLLSGGNQQKVVVAKWLHHDSDVLIFDEPTRGIDVGARAEIHDLIVSLADSGKAVVVVSSDLPEILNICDRVLVMSQGRIVGDLRNSEELGQHRVMDLMLADARNA
jgi:ribose transport system ATP-binding protein